MLDLYKTKRKREPVKVFPDGREVCSKLAHGLRLYRDRTYEMAKRQGFVCALCGISFRGRPDMTFDHQDARGMNGSHRDDRIEIDGQWNNAAVHETCNAIKGSKRYYWKEGKYVPMSTGDEA